MNNLFEELNVIYDSETRNKVDLKCNVSVWTCDF